MKWTFVKRTKYEAQARLLATARQQCDDAEQQVDQLIGQLGKLIAKEEAIQNVKAVWDVLSDLENTLGNHIDLICSAGRQLDTRIFNPVVHALGEVRQKCIDGKQRIGKAFSDQRSQLPEVVRRDPMSWLDDCHN